MWWFWNCLWPLNHWTEHGQPLFSFLGPSPPWCTLPESRLLICTSKASSWRCCSLSLSLGALNHWGGPMFVGSQVLGYSGRNLPLYLSWPWPLPTGTTLLLEKPMHKARDNELQICHMCLWKLLEILSSLLNFLGSKGSGRDAGYHFLNSSIF